MGQEQTQEITPNEGQEYVYLLELQNKKYYVGRTNNVERRLNEHRTRSDVEWVRAHGFVRLVCAHPITSRLEEDLEVKKAMLEFGVDNVRGGTYSASVLPLQVKALLQNELVHAEDKCFACGSQDHYVAQCGSGKPKVAAKPKANINTCVRCQRNNHTLEKCNAFTKLDGTKLCAGVTKEGNKCRLTPAGNYKYCKHHYR